MERDIYYDQMFKNYYSLRCLTTSEENILIEQAQKGNKEAVVTLVNDNLAFLFKQAYRGRYYNRRIAIDDYFQASTVGFIKAIMKSDSSKGPYLRAFAKFYIKKELCLLAKQSNLIRVPPYLFWGKYKKKNINANIFETLGVDVKLNDISTDYDVQEESRCDPVDSALIKEMLKSLSKHNPKWGQIIKHRYFSTKTKSYKEVAPIFKCSRENIFQMEKKALKYFKEYLKKRNINCIGDVL